MPRSPKSNRGDKLDQVFTLAGQHIRLGPGVVGRNSSIAWLGLVALLFLGYYAKSNTWLLGICIVGCLLLALAAIGANTYFGQKNPGAAILEGADFLQHEQLMASKEFPVIESSESIPTPKTLAANAEQKAELEP